MDWDKIAAVSEHEVKLLSDLEYFAAQVLKIRPKSGGLVPFIFNPVQRKLHRIIEEQRALTGTVRIVVLKARQEGVSTYVAGRYYHKTIKKPGFLTAIVAHEKPAVRNLFGLVKRMHDHVPEELRPETGASNADELKFSNIDSGYIVSVATEDGAGRSSTAQALHASEAAFWVNLKEQLAALMETVPDLPDTEIIVETTGNQFGDEFHQFWRAAVAGLNSFKAVFLPWSDDPTYRKAIPDDFEMTSEEKQLAGLHGLDAEQIYWRRCKIADKGDINYFKREYPLTPDEAFLASNFDSYIPHDIVMRARKSEHKGAGPLIVGVDPARFGADSTAIAWRRGSGVEKIQKRHGLDTMQVAGWVAKIIRDDKPAKVNIDIGGLGAGIYDRLVELGYRDVVNAVNFGSKPVEPPPLDDTGKPSGGPANRRAEMWSNVKTALEGAEFSLPDSESLHADLTGPGYTYTSDGRLQLESKDQMKKRGMPSPDEGDAVALCFSEPDGSPIPRSIATNFNRKIEYSNVGIV